MSKFKRILLVLDAKTKQNTVLDYVKFLAKENVIHVTVLSVVKNLSADLRMVTSLMSPEQLLEVMRASEQEKVDAFAATLCQSGIEATSKVLNGTPFLEIIRQVIRENHDLVMIMAEGKGGGKDRLFGSTSMHLMRKCPCPVWVIKPVKNVSYKKILVAVDTTVDIPDLEQDPFNELILHSAESMVEPGSNELHVVQVWSVLGEGYMEVRAGVDDRAIIELRREVKQQCESGLDSLLSGIASKGFTFIKHLPRSDDASKAIIRLAKRERIDLLVMGTVCRTGVAGFLIGNTAEKVLNEVNCSVLTVKPKGFETPITLED